MREIKTENVLIDLIKKTPVGHPLSIQFEGLTTIIDIKMTFSGGWVVSQTIIPGKPFEFTRGQDGFLESIEITINPYDGLQSCTTKDAKLI